MTLVRCSALVALMMVALLQPAQAAEITLRQALAEHGNSREFRQAIEVAGRAYDTMNSFIKVRGDTQFYCPPESIELTADQYMKVLSDYLTIDPAALDRPSKNWSFLLLLGLVNAFPCK